jgi:pseudouridine synthase
MRLNKYIALATGISRRAADAVISERRVLVNGNQAEPGQDITEADRVVMDGTTLVLPNETQTIMFHKPVGYVSSRNGQGSKTIYDVLPSRLHALKPVGRLDKDSSGLLLLTNDGTLAHELTHPSKLKIKIYLITLDKPLEPLHQQMINDFGVQLKDGPSKLRLEKLDDATQWRVSMSEGRNRQIRRTFASLGYEVVGLHRIQFGSFTLGDMPAGEWHQV